MWLRQRFPVMRYSQLFRWSGSRHWARCRYARTRLSATASAASGLPSMRVANRISPGSYRRMMIPKASRSPPKIRATIRASDAVSLTLRGGTRAGRVWSRGWGRGTAGQDFTGGAEERGGADAGAVHAAGERLEGRFGAAAVRRVAGRLGESQQDARRPGIGAGENVVEDLLGAIGQGRRGGV